MEPFTKEEIISSIKCRILNEQRKHPTLDWAEIAARKIYSSWIKETQPVPLNGAKKDQ